MARMMVLLTAIVASAAAPAVAQRSEELQIFERGGFKGASLAFSEPTQHITPAFTARSVRLSGNSAWELCSGNTYTGCRRVDQSSAGSVFIVRSVRPVAPVLVNRVSPPNQSLRGVASEFFVAPHRGSKRVTAVSPDGEAMRRAADDFCRSAGWQTSVHAQVQQDGASYDLVDVLCTNKP